MAPAAEECRPDRGVTGEEIPAEVADDVQPLPSPAKSFCCRCCGCWQRRKRSRPPRGTDKVGNSDKETLLSGGKTRFYCCETKMTTRPPRGQNRVGNRVSATNSGQGGIETATAVNSGLCSLFRSRGPSANSFDANAVPPIDFAFDAFDSRAYMEEFDIIHQEEYDVSRTIANPLFRRRTFIRRICRRKHKNRHISSAANVAVRRRGSDTSTSYSSITPHSEILFHPSQVGRAIIIKGKTYPTAQRFAVNLVCRENSDIAMHFNPRLDRGYIARNTKLNGHWGEEENSLNGPSPFQRGEEFTLHILVAEDEYKFCHNGRHICSYRHRVPLGRLHFLDIHGDLTLSLVKHELMEEYPPAVPPLRISNLLKEPTLLSVGHTALLLPTTNSWQTDIPKQSFFFLGHFEPNISIGNEIIIGGNVRLLPHAFFINLQDGLRLWKPPEVHLHINPRFGNHNETIVNARLRGAWGYEERHNKCRFQPGRPFQLTIRVEEDRYCALVNGKVIVTMDHRARPSDVNSLYISGDVDITSIGFRTALTSMQSNELSIADDTDWLDIGMDEEDAWPIHSSARSSREESLSPDMVEGKIVEPLNTAEIEKGMQILDLWKRDDKKKSTMRLSTQIEEIDSILLDEVERETVVPPKEPQVMPEDFEPVPVPKKLIDKEKMKKEVSIKDLIEVITLPSESNESFRERSPHIVISESPQVPPTTREEEITKSDSPQPSTSQAIGTDVRKESDVDRTPVLTYSQETLPKSSGRSRNDSTDSDSSIFLSAQHTITKPSVEESVTGTPDHHSDISVSSSQELKTDNVKKSKKEKSKKGS